MRLAPGASRRTLLIIGASVAFVASACSTSGSDSSSTTTVPATTSSTVAATTSTEAAPASTSTTETAPETTVAPTTTEAAPTESEAEDVAVAFLRAAVDGDDPSAYVNDPAVAEAATLEWADVADGDRAGFTVAMEPTYVAPEAQGGDAGECQLVGDITLQCAVLVSPPATTSGEGSPTLYAVYVTNLDPATSLDDPTYIDYFVIDFEPIAG